MVFRIIEKYEQDQIFGGRNQREDVLDIHGRRTTIKYDNKVMTIVDGMVVTMVVGMMVTMVVTMVMTMVVEMVVGMVVTMVVGMVRRFEWVFIASLLCGSIVAPWSAELFIPTQPHRSYICATHPYCTTSTTTNHILSALITNCAILHFSAESRVGRVGRGGYS